MGDTFVHFLQQQRLVVGEEIFVLGACVGKMLLQGGQMGEGPRAFGLGQGGEGDDLQFFFFFAAGAVNRVLAFEIICHAQPVGDDLRVVADAAGAVAFYGAYVLVRVKRGRGKEARPGIGHADMAVVDDSIGAHETVKAFGKIAGKACGNLVIVQTVIRRDAVGDEGFGKQRGLDHEFLKGGFVHFTGADEFLAQAGFKGGAFVDDGLPHTAGFGVFLDHAGAGFGRVVGGGIVIPEQAAGGRAEHGRQKQADGNGAFDCQGHGKSSYRAKNIFARSFIEKVLTLCQQASGFALFSVTWRYLSGQHNIRSIKGSPMVIPFIKRLINLEHTAEDALERAEHKIEHVVEDATHAVITAEKKAAQGAMKVVDAAANFFRLEASGGIVLVMAALLALVVANSFLAGPYDSVLNKTDFRIGFSHPNGFDMELKKSILLWINDGLMAIFFFLVGLEIKREIVAGELSSRDRALLPALAAIGGMIVPAAIYAVLNMANPAHLQGWAIPAATDIAFALGILALAGKRAPFSLKVLLSAIAIIDDLGAILIIAIFYNHGFNPEPLYFAAVALAGLFILNRKGVAHPAGYILLGVVLWVAVLESGIHATLAGVITALFIPMSIKGDKHKSPGHDLEHALHPWIAFSVLPLFAFANAGVPFSGMGLDLLASPVTLGIAGGLFLGKQLGVFTMLFVAIKSGLCPMPKDANWLHLYAVAVLCGIGFTMSLFIGGLAFHGHEMQAAVRIGVLGGSILAAGLAFVLLHYAGKRAGAATQKA